MSGQIVEPEECLRSLADEAMRDAESGAQVLHCTLRMRAAANAFVLLGLIPEGRADKVLADYQEGLQTRSLGTAWGLMEGELPTRSGAGEVWEAHVAGPAPLPGVPRAMVPVSATFPATVSGLAAELRFEWAKLAGDQWRVSFRASADHPGGEPDRPSVVMREALAMFTVTDDTGHRYRPRVERVSWDRVASGGQEWRGDLVADPGPEGRRPAWLEISSMESGTEHRIDLTLPSEAASGDAGAAAALVAPRWPTPAEGYLAELSSVAGVKVGWTDVEPAKTAEIVAVVADCLLAVGALPAGGELLRGGRPAPRPPGWQEALAARWAHRAQLIPEAVGAGAPAILLATLPFAHASAVIESVRYAGGTVGVTLHGRPWVAAPPWPVVAPCFTVQAADEDGNAYEGMLEGFQAGSDAAGTGTFWLWPPVPAGTASLTVTVGTLWEAAQVTVKITDGSA